MGNVFPEELDEPLSNRIMDFANLICRGADPSANGPAWLIRDNRVTDQRALEAAKDRVNLPHDKRYGTLALFQYDGPKGPHWTKWNKALLEALVPHQRAKADGCKDGSWDTERVDRWAYAGGRVYGTAMNVLTLEVYYRYATVKKADEKKPEEKK